MTCSFSKSNKDRRVLMFFARSKPPMVVTVLAWVTMVGCNPNGPDVSRAPTSQSDSAPTHASPERGAAGSGYTAFAISEEAVGPGTAEAFYGFTIQLVGQRCTVWTDVGRWNFDELTPRTASAFYQLPDGQKLSWKCHTPDERIFTGIEICGREYLLSEGRLFLISTQSKIPQVVQLQAPGAESAALEVLSTQFTEGAQFVARQQLTPTGKDALKPN